MKLLKKKQNERVVDFTNCQRCPLCKIRRNVVLGRTPLAKCDILFIGDYPSTSDDLFGEVFTGAVGKMLDKNILDAELSGTHYFMNCIMCRPTNSRGAESRIPHETELLACSKNIDAMLSILKPEKVVLMGDLAGEMFKGDFKHSIKIIHPRVLLFTGGTSSPVYINTINTLSKLK